MNGNVQVFGVLMPNEAKDNVRDISCLDNIIFKSETAKFVTGELHPAFMNAGLGTEVGTLQIGEDKVELILVARHQTVKLREVDHKKKDRSFVIDITRNSLGGYVACLRTDMGRVIGKIIFGVVSKNVKVFS